MVFVIHPLTQQSGEPKYTANDFRLTVSNFLTAATGETFGAVQGVRSDSFSALTSMSGSTITVHPHSGIIAPWTGVGAYAYAITSDITVPRPTTGDYYVVLVVEDPSQSHGSEPQGRVALIPVSTTRASINGLVIAKTTGSSINEIANRLRNGTVIETVSKAELDLVKPAPRTKGFVRFGDGMGEYEYDGSKWVPVGKGPVLVSGVAAAIIANAMGADAVLGRDVTFPNPFKTPPLVWADSKEVKFNAAIQNVTTTGCKYWVLNCGTSPNTSDVYPVWFAYGELA